MIGMAAPGFPLGLIEHAAEDKTGVIPIMGNMTGEL